MTKYDNCSIYKLVCKNPDITDFYIGSTKNFRNRKYDHKGCCNNPNKPPHMRYMYQFIRANGGWDNWDMIEICNVSCISKRDLEKKEREIFEELKPTLNQNIPFTTKQEKREQTKKSHNRPKYNERKREKLTCECGAVVSRSHMARHKNESKKHKKYLDNILNGFKEDEKH